MDDGLCASERGHTLSDPGRRLYENTDGSFTDSSGMGIEEMIARCKVVQELHEKLAFCEMTRHELLDDCRKEAAHRIFRRNDMGVDLETGEYGNSTAQ